ncbi:MAG: hypothetical protein R2751_08015 [Bacteroidales bacterium]
MQLERLSLGIGDRFGKQGAAQLAALEQAHDRGVEVIPVWNKSHREHTSSAADPKTRRGRHGRP